MFLLLVPFLQTEAETPDDGSSSGSGLFEIPGTNNELWNRWNDTMDAHGCVEAEIQLIRFKSPQDIQGEFTYLHRCQRVDEVASL